MIVCVCVCSVYRIGVLGYGENSPWNYNLHVVAPIVTCTIPLNTFYSYDVARGKRCTIPKSITKVLSLHFVVSLLPQSLLWGGVCCSLLMWIFSFG